jgi:WD40 repeat protein
VWDARTGKELLTLSAHNDWLASVAFSPDGAHLATSSWDGTVIVWETLTGQQLFHFTASTDTTRQVVFSPDGTRLATAGLEGSAKLWDAVSGKELLTLSGHTGAVFSVAFSPDGKHLVSASDDKTAKLWDVLTGKELLTIHAPDALTSVAFSPDCASAPEAPAQRCGSQIAVASRDGTNRIYLLKIEDLVALAKQRVTRSLTTEECQQYLHVEQCPSTP